MLPNPRFLKQPKSFWAEVRTIGQAVGYTVPRKRIIRVPTIDEISKAYDGLNLETDHLFDEEGTLTNHGKTLIDYFEYRADRLNSYVKPRLMDGDEAEKLYEKIRKDLKYKGAPTMNKQKGSKKKPAFLTCIINMLVEEHAKGHSFDPDPRELTTVTMNGVPLRTLARRVDGAFPSAVNPIAIWEIKEYYYTTTFGSRVADGVYETLLDGMELEELREHENIDVKHYMMLDSHYTWWECGRSYLCRIVDMLHMGYVDEVLFGKEVAERLPTLVPEWVKLAKDREG